MAKYDASNALDELFVGSDYTDGAGAAVAASTEAILDGPTASDSIEAVLRLADGLPGLDEIRDVPQGDISELTEREQQQKERTEAVIQTALATGDASVWVIAQGLERAAKGKWWRRTHATYEAYVEALLGKSAVYARQLRANAPLALETAQRTGTVPQPNQIKETRKTQQKHGTDAAVALYKIVRDVSRELGERPTAVSLQAVHRQLPDELPGIPEQQQAAILEVAREVLGAAPASIEAGGFESEPNGGASIEAPGETGRAGLEASGGDDGIEDAEVVPEHLVALKDALRQLRVLDKALSGDVLAQAAAAAAADPGDAEEYTRARSAIIKTATTIRNRALRAPEGSPGVK
ncbi:hypothetical protein [Streptomyces sp. NPDC004579]|uniref:hypothetical protein n=1 Tax=Streptomyces sp. NPDC004579 TaxID=3154667 RepID=UPI0033B89EDC